MANPKPPKGNGIMSSVKKGFSYHALGAGMSIGFQVLGGETNLVKAVGKGLGYHLLDQFIPGAMYLSTFYSVAENISTAIVENHRYGNQKLQKYYQGNFGGNFRDTQAGYTMRQRGVQAIQQSQLNARSVLGSEARTYHTSF